MAKIDHSTCDHPRTPAGRRACRDSQKVQHPASNAKANWPKDETDGAAARRNRVNKLQNKLMGVLNEPETVRIQPRKAGARVSASGSTCVQAALHVDAHGGRCACGWVAA